MPNPEIRTELLLSIQDLICFRKDDQPTAEEHNDHLVEAYRRGHRDASVAAALRAAQIAALLPTD